MKYGAIILAAGKGTRFHAQKQFFKLQGKPLWNHVFDKTVSVIELNQNIIKVGIDIPGGVTRTDSVRIGLKNLDEDTNRVIVIEAARPLVTQDQIRQLLFDSEDSTTFVMPLVNTVIGRDGSYYDRSSFYELLTPQAFNYPKLVAAYNSEKYSDMTDETRVMYEEYGIKPHFIETGDNLIKVTYPRDIAVITELIKERGDQV